MDTNYIALDLPRPHFRLVLIYHRPVINLIRTLLNLMEKKAYFPLLFQVHSLKYVMRKIGNKFDFILGSASDLDYQIGKWL